MPMENELNRINEVLNIKLKNLTIDAINLQIINEIKEELKGFDDLFNADELSCIDQPIAACAGIYGSDYKNNIATCPWEKR